MLVRTTSFPRQPATMKLECEVTVNPILVYHYLVVLLVFTTSLRGVRRLQAARSTGLLAYGRGHDGALINDLTLEQLYNYPRNLLNSRWLCQSGAELVAHHFNQVLLSLGGALAAENRGKAA
jgi:hypothetical protein